MKLPSPAVTPRQLAVAALAIVSVWTILCAVGALGSYNDHMRRGLDTSYGLLVWYWWRAHLPLMLLSFGLFAAFARWPVWLGRASSLATAYIALVMVFLPLELLYTGMLGALREGQQLTLENSWMFLQAMRKYEWFIEFSWLTFTYVGVAGICAWRLAGKRERAWQQAQNDNLRLHLQLEQQRLIALRAQLEPHFLFNAMNAISALVRTDEKRVALEGIGRLSELLRYATMASERCMVTLGDELVFVRDYLALQGLRYEERLHVRISGDDAQVLDADCPPLLLQPLIENALRHDLDCHDGDSDITLQFEHEAGRLTIRVSNPLAPHGQSNPGMGLGLRHTKERLSLAYGHDAGFSAGPHNGRFVVEIHMPLHHG